MLSSAAGPSLCLAAGPATRTVVVSGCVVHAGEAVYDPTVRGEVPLRGAGELVLAPGAGDPTGVVVAARDGACGRRRVVEPEAETGVGVPDPPGGRAGSGAPAVRAARGL